MSFYVRNFKLDADEAVVHKDRYIRNLLEDDLLYKFISFDENDNLNTTKIDALINETVWMSHYKQFEDSTELKIPINKYKVSNKTGRTIEKIEFLIGSLREIYDVCCFTYKITPYMWRNYANDSNGICLCFRVLDSDKYFPVEYINKKHFDLTESMIKSVNDNLKGVGFGSIEYKSMSLLPLVLKDKKYQKEKEIRVLTSPFDDENGIFGGVVRPDVKEEFNYKGTSQKYSDINLKLAKVVIGDNCSDVYMNKVKEIMNKRNIPCITKI